ncbi:MAG: hypothetical protein AAF901_12970, partial [Bacteroidota bacterium]
LKGFSITNESGVRYEFLQPVYSYGENIYSENIEKRKGIENDQPVGGHAFNHLKKPDKYAYSWLLTAMKGPDYVDRTGDDLSEDDWGYWVQFDYGKWTNKYGWRTPDEGFIKDINNGFQTFSQGYKELYYLDAIKTATHTALFVKSIREDGHGAVIEFYGFSRRSGRLETVLTDSEGNVLRVDDGGFEPKTSPTTASRLCENYKFPIATLTLDKIILMSNEELVYEKDEGNYYSPELLLNKCGDRSPEVPHLSGNILDIQDLENNMQVIEQNALRVVDFKHDYSLAQATPNSFSNENLYQENPAPLGTRGGKLTLREIIYKGKGGVQVMPGHKFGYELEDQSMGTGKMNFLGEISGPNFNIAQIGDVISINDGEHYGLVTSVSPHFLGTNIAVKKIGDGDLPLGSVTFSVTKNPPFDRNFVDLWGFYKSDFTDTKRHNLDKLTTEISGKNVDVWSLRNIKSPLGASTTIEYESDTYGHSVFTSGVPVQLGEAEYNLGRITAYLGDNLPVGSDGKVRIAYTSEERLECLSSCDDFPHLCEQLDQICAFYNYADPVFQYREIDVNDLTYIGDGYYQFNTPNLHSFGEVGNFKFHRIKIRSADIQFERDVFYGGGLRVKSITNQNTNESKRFRTNYDYSDISLEQASSGVTSYEPIISDPLFQGLSEEQKSRIANDYGSDLLGEVLAYARFIPGPGVFYK